MAMSVLILGFAVQTQWYYMVLAVFAAINCAGIMVASTAINAYLLNCYPEGPGEVCAWIAIGRIFSGGMSVYVQLPWVAKLGAAKVLGIQAAISFSAIFVIAFLQWYGKGIRQAQGEWTFIGLAKRHDVEVVGFSRGDVLMCVGMSMAYSTYGGY